MSARRALDRLSELEALLDGRGFADLADTELLGGLDLLGQARRLVDAIGVEAVHEVGERTVLPTGQSLARVFGAKSAVDVMVERVGISPAEAGTWSRVADAVMPDLSLTGEVLPPRFPAVAEGVVTGAVSLFTAETVIRAVDEIRQFLPPCTAIGLEASLVAQADEFSRREFQKLCRRVPETLMPEGVELREALQRARSGLRIRQLDDGLTEISIRTHPEGEGFILTAIDARTAPRRQPSFDDEADQATLDRRPLEQRRLDAMIDIARESIGRDGGQLAGTSVTMLVTITEQALRTGPGTAEIAGVDETISAATARRLAADAEIIPCVLGGPSEILDQGRAFRLFTEAQRRAMTVRDGGCVWTGCSAPPSWCEVAHLTSWLEGGATDLSNGVLLCAFHHRCLDNDGWLLEWREGALWLKPPAHVDATRTPRPAGKRELVFP